MHTFVVVVIRDMLITLPYLVKDKTGPDKRERSHLLWKLKETVSVIFQKEEVEVNAYGSPIRTVNRARSRETTVTGAVAAPSTSDAKSNRVVRIRSN